MDSFTGVYKNKQVAMILTAAGAELSNTLLIHASRFDWPEIVERVVSEDFDLDEVDSDGETAVMIAAQYGHGEIVNLLIKAGVDINKTYTFYTAFELSVFNGHLHIAKMLLEADARVNNSLFTFINHGKVEGVKLLIEHDQSIVHRRARNPADNVEYTPVMIAIARDCEKIAKVLIESHADLSFVNSNGETALTTAVKKSYVDIVKLIIGSSAEHIDVCDSHGLTAIHYAISNNDDVIVQLLLDAHVKSIPIEYAISFKRWKIVVMLIDKELSRKKIVKLKLNHSDGLDILETAMIMRYEKVLRFFKGFRADSLLMKYCKDGDLYFVSVLLELGVDINTRWMEHETPLIMAVSHGHSSIAEFLVKKGADVNAQDRIGESALVKAVKNQNLELVKFLILSRANVNQPTHVGSTALLYAVVRNQPAIVKVLMKAGATQHKNDLGVTPLSYAVSKKMSKIIEIFQKKEQ